MKIEDAKNALLEGKWGVLCTCSGSIPYGVPVNYYYSFEENALFFHCAKKGRKLDNISLNNKVSFAVVTQNKLVGEKLTTLYQSVIITGRASVLENSDEKLKRLKEFCRALAPESSPDINESENCFRAAAIVRIDIDDISGKSNC